MTVEDSDDGAVFKPPDGRSSEGDFRAKFLQRLSHSKVWVPAAERPPKSQTVIIFDWDDTLLCTSFLIPLGDDVPRKLRACLQEIGRAARSLLELSSRLGQTFVITNALSGWVEYSAAQWAPDLLPALRQVDVVSARTRHEPKYPEARQWKVQAFLEVQRQLGSQAVGNLISVGDSDFEMDAVRAMGREFEQAAIKTVRFWPRPTPQELLKELQMVARQFEVTVRAGTRRKLVIQGQPAGRGGGLRLYSGS